MSGEIELRERCPKCHGEGATYDSRTDGSPCWRCRGRGFLESLMETPDPRWSESCERTLQRVREQEGK